MNKNSLYETYKSSRFLRVLLQLLLLVVIYFSIKYWQQKDYVTGPAPVIVDVQVDGQSFSLLQQTERPLLVHFWASWCPMCAFENSNIEALAKDYDVITIASWSGNKQEVATYLQQEKLTYPVIVDEHGEWAKLYNVTGVPASFFIDENGVIQMIERGYTTELGLRLRMWWLQNF